MIATPKDFQIEAIQRHVELIRKRGASAEASVAGFGKTFVASFVARELRHPLVVCCPKVVIPHWQEAAKLCGAEVRCISNYEQFKPIPRKWKKDENGMRVTDSKGHYVREKIEEKHRVSHTGLGHWKILGRTWQWDLPKPSLIVFDEAQYLRDRTSQNSKMAIAAKRQGIPTLLMSASLAVDPLDMYTTGYCLGLHNGDSLNFLGWASGYGVERGRFAYEFNPRQHPDALGRLNALLFPAYGHRKSYEDIPGFPPEVTEALPVDIGDDAARLDALWTRIHELETLHAEAPTEITERLRARQISELSKVPAFADLARQCIDAGQSPIIFVNFKDTLRALSSLFPAFPVIEGGQYDLYRKDAVRRFQDDEVRGMIVQIQAGGVGISLHDTHGRYPRHSLISPPDSAINLLQALGRNRRVGGKTPAFRTLVFAAGTVEERVRRTVTAKLGQIETINDGDLDPIL